MAEMTPEEIKEKKPYLDWSLTEREYDFICEKLLHRLPNYTETGLFSVMWSEHCSYKKSKPVLRLFPNKNERVLQGPGEGAGIIDIGDNQAVVFKAESHNHPSAVEPYEGAATGVGGILRDIFSMGARPIASLDSLHFGEIDRPRTKYLINEVVAGIGGYGNCMGIPTIAGEMTFEMQSFTLVQKPDVTASMGQRLLLLILTMKKKLSVQQFRSAIRLWKSF